MLRQGLRVQHAWAVMLPRVLIDLGWMAPGTGGLAVSLLNPNVYLNPAMAA